MTTRLLTLGLSLALLASLIGSYLLGAPATSATGSLLLTYGAEGARLLAWGLLISGGTIVGTRYFRANLLLGGLLLVGALFKLLHYPGANGLLTGALGGLAVLYSVRFARKPIKGQLDIVKLLLVLGSCGSTWLLLLHLAPSEVRYLPPCLLALAVLDFLYLENRKRAAGVPAAA